MQRHHPAVDACLHAWDDSEPVASCSNRETQAFALVIWLEDQFQEIPGVLAAPRGTSGLRCGVGVEFNGIFHNTYYLDLFDESRDGVCRPGVNRSGEATPFLLSEPTTRTELNQSAEIRLPS